MVENRLDKFTVEELQQMYAHGDRLFSGFCSLMTSAFLYNSTTCLSCLVNSIISLSSDGNIHIWVSLSPPFLIMPYVSLKVQPVIPHKTF